MRLRRSETSTESVVANWRRSSSAANVGAPRVQCTSTTRLCKERSLRLLRSGRDPWPTAAVCLTALVAAAGCRAADPPSAFVGGTLIVGTGETVENATMVVRGGRIECVGVSTDCSVPAGANEIDTDGFWIIPGLTDAHIHPRFGGRPDATEREQRLAFLLGVTLTRDASTAGELESSLAAAAAAANERSPVPRLVVAGRAPLEEIGTGDGADRAIDDLASREVGAIKVHEAFPVEALAPIVRAAARHDLPVYGHAWADGPVRSLVSESVDAGFAGLAHLLGVSALVVPADVRESPPAPEGSDAWRVWRRSLWLEASDAALDSAATALADAGVWIEPLLAAEHLWAEPYRFPAGLYSVFTLPFVADAVQGGPGVDFSQADRARLGRSVERMRDFVHRFHEAGGVLVTGSDRVIAPGLAIHEELRLLTEAGLSPAAALRSATLDAARVLGVSDSLGTLEAGKLADFVVLEGNPLEEITNTQLVSRVVKGGVIHDPSSLLEALHDDLRDRTTSPGPRLLIGLAATLIVVGGTILAILLQARRRTGRS